MYLEYTVDTIKGLNCEMLAILVITITIVSVILLGQGIALAIGAILAVQGQITRWCLCSCT